MSGRRSSKRTMAERREAWRSDVARHPDDWDLAHSWMLAELADLGRSRKRSLWLRMRTAGLARSVRRDAAVHLLAAKNLLEHGLREGAREHPGYAARRAEYDAARTPDERMRKARSWLMWHARYAGFPERDRIALAARLAELAECIAAHRRGR